MVAQCLVVNGPSAVGKSTLVRRLQDRADVPFLRFGVDELYAMVPAPWAGGTPGAAHADDGFAYAERTDGDGRTVTEIRTGPHARRMLLAMNAAIAAMLASGAHVIVDGQAFDAEANADLEARLGALAAAGTAFVYVVELRADLATLEARDRIHPHPTGLFAGHALLPAQSARPDLRLDTTSLDAEEVVDRVWRDFRRARTESSESARG